VGVGAMGLGRRGVGADIFRDRAEVLDEVGRRVTPSTCAESPEVSGFTQACDSI